MTTKRFERVCTLLNQHHAEALAINAGPDLKYFTGLDFHVSERPAILLISAKGEAAFIFPEFEKDKVRQSSIPLKAFPYPKIREPGLRWPNKP
jgi:Xaa-Pro aminopeptidase